jgi:hypothetical protein
MLDNHWNIFDNDYYTLKNTDGSLNNFRRNGLSNMLEIGLPKSDHSYLYF